MPLNYRSGHSPQTKRHPKIDGCLFVFSRGGLPRANPRYCGRIDVYKVRAYILAHSTRRFTPRSGHSTRSLTKKHPIKRCF